MTKRFLKEMIQASLTNKSLDEKKINTISAHLSRSELKVYLRALKNYTSKNSVTVVSALALPTLVKKDFAQRFSGKNLLFEIEPGLLFGVKIVEGDMVYDQTLSSSFQNLVEFVKE